MSRCYPVSWFRILDHSGTMTCSAGLSNERQCSNCTLRFALPPFLKCNECGSTQMVFKFAGRLPAWLTVAFPPARPPACLPACLSACLPAYPPAVGPAAVGSLSLCLSHTSLCMLFSISCELSSPSENFGRFVLHSSCPYFPLFHG